MSRFLAIPREAVFSPGKVDADRAVLEETAQCLRARGHDVEMAGTDAAAWPEPVADTVVFSMSQGDAALSRLQAWEDRGVRIVNRPAGIRNCRREPTVATLAGVEETFPATVIAAARADAALPDWACSGAVWIKRGDVHAVESDDVVRVDGEAALREALRRFGARGIHRAAIQRHVPGTVVKFYAVRERFFFAVPPPGAVPPGPDLLWRIAAAGARAARLLGVDVYGGDCVCDAAGAVTLIDLNDWPSYGTCRHEAAENIAFHLLDVAPC